ncbi:MAG: cyclase family protein [Actinobacteria bacterium]|nr:cyclase family protein [Actinomycetota bacterium]
MSTVIDISLPISPALLVWPGNPGIEVLPQQRIADGDDANVSELRLGTHTGTHVDPPLHFVAGGAGIDRVPLDTLMGPAVVADARGLPGELGAAELEGLGVPEGTERLLLRTDNSDLWRRLPADFPADYTCLGVGGADWIVRRGIRLVGVDFLSVERRGAPGHPTHKALLANGVTIVEGLDLGEVEPGGYELRVLPLRIVNGDGGPARAVLVRGLP